MLPMLTGLIHRRPTAILWGALAMAVIATVLGGGVLGLLDVATTQVLERDLLRAQLLAGLVSLAALVLMLRRGLAAGLPLGVGAVAVVGGFGLLRVVAELASVTALAAAVVVLLGIGLAVPYSLYVLERFEEELAAGYAAPDAAARTAETAGRTIVVGAGVLVLSIAGLLVLPSADLRATAIAGIATVLVTAAAAVVVLPAGLAVLGHRIDRLRLPGGQRARPGSAAVVRRVVDHPVASGLTAVVALGVLGTPVLGIDLSSAADGMAMTDVEVRLPLLIAIVAIGAFILLVVELGSIALPLQAITAGLVSLLPAFGLLVWGVQHGDLQGVLGRTLDLGAAAVVFCVGFGVSMQSLLHALAKVKAEHARTGEPRSSVMLGFSQAEGVLTTAAVAMVVVLLAFVTAETTVVSQLAMGLAVVVLAQATVVRGVLLPSLLVLAQAVSWQTPQAVRRVRDRLGLNAHIDLAPPAAAVTRSAPVGSTAGEEVPRAPTVGPYRLLRSLGRDQTSETFLASGPATRGALYAAVRLFDDINIKADYERAGAVLRRYADVDSPHLARLFDVGLWEGHLYYGMEFVPLGSLANPVHPLGLGERLGALAGAARGLHALHEAGLLFRDIRPNMILLAPEGAKLAGLGLVQLLAEERRDVAVANRFEDTHHTPVNDPAYVAPAVLRGDDASVASDLFALGATMHETLSGTSVFGAMPEASAARLAHAAAAPITVSHDLREDLRVVVQRLLGLDRPYATAAEAAAALAAVAV